MLEGRKQLAEGRAIDSLFAACCLLPSAFCLLLSTRCLRSVPRQAGINLDRPLIDSARHALTKAPPTWLNNRKSGVQRNESYHECGCNTTVLLTGS